MKSILVFSSLYPNSANPVHGLFAYNLCKALAERCEVTVVAPLNGNRVWKARKAPVNETTTLHPVFWNVPRFLKQWDAVLMAACCRNSFQNALKAKPNLVHAHYAYPDAAAAAILAKEAHLPLVVTVHGSDINVIAHDPKRRPLVISALCSAQLVVAVSQELAAKVAGLGVPADNIVHIPNGVDISLFQLGNKYDARKLLDVDERGSLLLAVGRLSPVKGYDMLLKAIAALGNEYRLILIGEGPERNRLAKLSRELGIERRVIFTGAVGHDKLPMYYQAADMLVISSYSEGWPTIIFEAAACGTPVVSAAVGGVPEIIAAYPLGTLIPDNHPETIAASIFDACGQSWDRNLLHQIATAHSWISIATKYIQIFNRCLKEES